MRLARATYTGHVFTPSEIIANRIICPAQVNAAKLFRNSSRVCGYMQAKLPQQPAKRPRMLGIGLVIVNQIQHKN
jgi:hypothetical protein